MVDFTTGKSAPSFSIFAATAAACSSRPLMSPALSRHGHHYFAGASRPRRNGIVYESKNPNAYAMPLVVLVDGDTPVPLKCWPAP